MKADARKVTTCRMCKGKKLEKIVSLGQSPLANSFLKKSDVKNKEHFFPLELLYCKNCKLIQLSYVVNPDLLFKNYLYVSSTSQTFVNHFELFAKDVFSELHLEKEDLVLDVGSNDGILLKPFKKLGCRVLGVDPAENVAPIAEKNGVPTIVAYFTKDIAKGIVHKYGHAKIVTGTNVFAHVDDLDELITAVKEVLSPDGVFIIEVPYLVDFLEKNLFDTIYHEHLSYLSVRPLLKLFSRFDMEVFDVKRVSSHGGSIRVFVKRKVALYPIHISVSQLLKLEQKRGLWKIKTYRDFARKIKKIKIVLIAMLEKLKKENATIVGYGAPAKGNTLLNYFNINQNFLEYIVDDSLLKQGLFTPGMHIPILQSDMIKQTKPDYILILAWNFAESIMKKYSWFVKKGGKFIIPFPKPKILS